jgi:hypothetical protein
VSIGDHELEAGEPALEDLAEELVLRVLRLLGADGHREELAVPVEADSVCHERRDVLDRPSPPCVSTRRVLPRPSALASSPSRE